MKHIARTVFAWSLLVSSALAVSPQIRTISPIGGQRGSEVEVTVGGSRLADAKDFIFYQPGISVTKLTASKDGELKATFRIAADAPLGLHDFRLRTATGITSLRTFSVGSLKEVKELEPNNDFSKPQPVEMNVTINGIAANEDIDYYAIKAKKGERITVEVEGIRLGLTLFDPYVAILDEKRFELASSDDSALIWQDGFVSMTAPKDGTYIIAAREAAYAGNANCLYRLHVGNFPRPTATIPSGGKVGEPVTVRWIGDVMGERTTKLTLPASFERNFGLFAQDERGVAPYPNVFRLSEFGNTIEAEPNNSPETATPFEAPKALNGVIGSEGDVDQFVFKASKGQRYDVRVFARQLRSPLDPVLTITAKNGGRVGLNDDSGGPDSYLRFTAPKDGEYVVSVADHLKKGGRDYTYRIELGPVRPNLTISTPNESLRRGSGVMAVAVPRGNRQAILINARRSDFGGALALSASGLPKGVKFSSDNMTASNTVIPVLFEADANAPLEAGLAKVAGKPLDSKVEIPPSDFLSTCELVLGQNNTPFWTRTVDSLAVAVTEEAPFTIAIVEPKVPIVRGGSMELKVVAKRKPGFTAPIAIQLPWNPPGLSSKADTVIPEGQNEAKILVNASNGAEINTWKIVVNGTYTEPPPPGTTPQAQRRGFRGRLTVSSDFAKLSVAQQFLTLKFSTVSVEQGKEVDLPVKINKLADFDGMATVTLVGLPNRVTTEPLTITKDSTDVVFHIKTESASPVGDNKNLFCRVQINKEGEPILHNLGTGRLRVDAPLAVKKPAPGAKPTVTTASNKKPQTSSAEKPLSRLEKLRQEAKERAKESGGGN